jgi:hypothetical protein
MYPKWLNLKKVDQKIEMLNEGQDHPFLTINVMGSKPVFYYKFTKINI